MGVRLADLLAGLSRLADLGFGLVAGEAVRSCLLATALARDLDLPDEQVRATYYTALLHHVGCTGYAHETSLRFGDELAMNAAAARTNLGDPGDVVRTFLPTIVRGQPPTRAVRMVGAGLVGGRAFGDAFTTATCEIGRDAARRLRLPEDVQRGVYHVYELWQGGGAPDGLAGDAIPVAARLARLSGVAVLYDTLGGPALAAEAIARRGGGMLDPDLAARFGKRVDALLSDLHREDPRAALLEVEPRPVVTVLDPELVEVATVFGDIADLKTPATHGHARGVATLARGAGERLGLPPGELVDLELAALLHDVGRVAIPDRVWERPGRLNPAEHELVRLHAYHSERILAASERLAPIAPLAGMHHERLDGSGYHRGVGAPDLSMAARILAAADAHQGMVSDRPHRPAFSPEEAERALLAETRRGRMDPEAVTAVLQSAGHDVVAAPADPPAGLTRREVAVLRLVAAGLTNREVASRLVISPRTAEHHVQHVYAKIGVSSRAAAALFAMEHGLLGDDG